MWALLEAQEILQLALHLNICLRCVFFDNMGRNCENCRHFWLQFVANVFMPCCIECVHRVTLDPLMEIPFDVL